MHILPAGWSYDEKVGTKDFYGFKGSFLSLDDMTALDDIDKHLKMSGKKSPALRRALDAMATA